MMSAQRREQLVRWLEMSWDTRTPEQRKQLLSVKPEMAGIVAGHEALGGIDQEEVPYAVELVERFFRNKRGEQNICAT